MEWNIFKRKGEKRDAGDAILSAGGNSVGLNWGSLFSQENAIGLSTVYRCVQLISDSLAVLPINVETKDGVRVKHSLDLVWRDTNNKLTKYEIMKLLVQSILLKGNGFIHIERNIDGSVKKLRWLESGDVNIVWNKIENTLYYTCPFVSQKKIEPINMIHIKNFSYDGINGLSVLNVGYRALKLAKSTENSALNYFDGGMNISGVLTVNSSLTPQQIKDIKKAWQETYITGDGGIAVLQGNMQYQPIASNANEAQLLENRNYSVEDICRWFGVSPILLGLKAGATYTTLEAAQNEFVLHTLLPYIVNIEEEFTKKLLKPSEQNELVINLDEAYLLRMDKESEARYYTTLVSAGIISTAEARQKLGYEYKEGTDNLIMPYTKISDNVINKTNPNEGD